jgi:ABC-type Fe3+/spermidine/putrescine transport system ATPase subunit
MSEWMIELRNITKRYGSLVANDRLDLQVGRGELLTLLGPSGCGKTTALRCLTGHQRPDEGQVFIDGQDVTGVPTYKRQLGMVFQNFALFPHMTVYENVEFPLMIRSLPKDERRTMVRDALRLIRMEELEERFPRQLSGGQQQRVGLARALVYHPKVLLLDEPLSNLDAKLREEMRFEIRELVSQLQMTAVYVTHDQGEALALSDRVAIMNAGRLQQVGTPREIYEQPRTLFVAGFIGLSEFFEGQVLAIEGDVARIAVKQLELSAPAVPGLVRGEQVPLFIRPNNVRLMEPEVAGGENTFDARVHKVTYLGESIDYRILLPGDLELRVLTDGRHYFAPGAPLRAQLPPEHCHIVVESGT